jgi:hypothetical protein
MALMKRLASSAQLNAYRNPACAAGLRLLLAVLALVAMGCSVGYVMHTVELPVEIARLAKEEVAANRLKLALFRTLFDFMIDRGDNQRILLSENQTKWGTCADIYGNMDQMTFASKEDERLVRRAVVDLTAPPLYFDFATKLIGDKCSGHISEYVDDRWELQTTEENLHRKMRRLPPNPKIGGVPVLIPPTHTKGCIMGCALLLPTVEQVEACRKIGIGTQNHNQFDEACLNNRTTCPNCYRLNSQPPFKALEIRCPMNRKMVDFLKLNTSKLPRGRLWGPRGSYTEEMEFLFNPSGEGAAHVADAYVLYKEKYDSYTPRNYKQWSFIGSVFFATTMLSTIGYGNFTPSTNTSKVILTLFALPMIATFGYALLQVASLMVYLGTSIVYGQCRRSARDDTHPMAEHFDISTRADCLRRHTSGSSLTMSQENLVSALLELYEIEITSQNRRLSMPSIDATFLEIHSAVHEQVEHSAHKDAAGAVELMEALAITHGIANGWHLTARSSNGQRKVILTLCMTVAITFFSAFVFWSHEQYGTKTDAHGNLIASQWSFIDALYFCVMTSTSVGLGDFTPDIFNSTSIFVFWVCYVLVSMGLFTLLAQQATVLAEHSHKQSRTFLQRVCCGAARTHTHKTGTAIQLAGEVATAAKAGSEKTPAAHSEDA